MSNARHRLNRPSPRRFFFHGIMLTLCLVLVWGAGLFAFAETLPKAPDDSHQTTQAIVVLTGGTGRVETGLDLLASGKADRLFVSGVYKGIDVKSLMRAFRRDTASLKDRIDIGTAEDTIANAIETARWMQHRAYTSLRLVTGAYHMPRSLLEFRRLLPTTTIIAHPVFPEHVKQDEWWAWPGTATLVASEYNKFLLAWLRHRAIALLAGHALTPQGKS